MACAGGKGGPSSTARVQMPRVSNRLLAATFTVGLSGFGAFAGRLDAEASVKVCGRGVGIGTMRRVSTGLAGLRLATRVGLRSARAAGASILDRQIVVPAAVEQFGEQRRLLRRLAPRGR